MRTYYNAERDSSVKGSLEIDQKCLFTTNDDGVYDIIIIIVIIYFIIAQTFEPLSSITTRNVSWLTKNRAEYMHYEWYSRDRGHQAGNPKRNDCNANSCRSRDKTL